MKQLCLPQQRDYFERPKMVILDSEQEFFNKNYLIINNITQFQFYYQTNKFFYYNIAKVQQPFILKL